MYEGSKSNMDSMAFMFKVKFVMVGRLFATFVSCWFVFSADICFPGLPSRFTLGYM